MRKFYIIGNGFDINHNLPTNYKYFREYIRVNNPSLEHRISAEFCNFGDEDSKLWNDFENSLSYFDIDYFSSKIDYSLMYQDNIRGEFSDSSWYDTQYNLSEETEIFYELKKMFSDWIGSIEVYNIERKYNFSPSDYFLNFNYTQTLEEAYSIRAGQICHIHGCMGVNIIVGHNIKYSDEFQNLKMDPDGGDLLYNPYNEDFRIEELREIISDRTNSFYKPIKEELIFKLEEWLNKFLNPSEIIVIGHSFGKSDWEYFAYLQERYPDSKWNYNCFDIKTQENLKEMLNTIS